MNRSKYKKYTKRFTIKLALIFFLDADTLDGLWTGKVIGNNGNHDDVEGVLNATIEGFLSRSFVFSAGRPRLANCVEDGTKQPKNSCKD